MILPAKAMATQELTVKRKPSENTLQVQASSPVALGVRIPTVALHMMELFDTTVEQLYSIFTVKDLTNKKIVMKWRCKNWPEGMLRISALYVKGPRTFKAGFFIWIHFPFHNAVIRFLFFFLEHYATVALNFVPTLGQTELQLDCKGVPVCKEENMKFCWQKQHFEEIKGLLQLTPLNG
ncbi:PREDICTED: activator of 90 kDa heat shock protein ATPase homolog 2 isoform X2 [Mandrillus leucophaeus]|uniref:activator of 90 kDa heat shock protein ATPase homolog 2 isoform X2 n=1 Tax=Mandrillus leucophaeus TaxID=9568 RepID=UPI0005F51A49|nr:PREDICTED: activator of 90 kDa heat shock protein ATPase homolog 2 isoform X2 [Mandrillus leucophaeus]